MNVLPRIFTNKINNTHIETKLFSRWRSFISTDRSSKVALREVARMAGNGSAGYCKCLQTEIAEIVFIYLEHFSFYIQALLKYHSLESYRGGHQTAPEKG